ncbi:MAG: hypothetical protein AB7G80_01690 [Dongiaceae bacterium]
MPRILLVSSPSMGSLLRSEGPRGTFVWQRERFLSDVYVNLLRDLEARQGVQLNPAVLDELCRCLIGIDAILIEAVQEKSFFEQLAKLAATSSALLCKWNGSDIVGHREILAQLLKERRALAATLRKDRSFYVRCLRKTLNDVMELMGNFSSQNRSDFPNLHRAVLRYWTKCRMQNAPEILARLRQREK